MPSVPEPRAAFSPGYIGLGIMGRPMARHLLNSGYSLRVHTRTRARADELLTAGAIWCDTPADLARQSDVVMLNVPDTPDVERVLFGPSGAAETLRRGSIVVDFSTIDPAAARRFAERLAAQDVAFLDAPVTGGQKGAHEATLTMMVGGDPQALERVRPLLSRMASHIVHVGPSGAGQALKACNQILCAVNMIGVCEALLLAERSGLDLATAIDTLSRGAGGSWAWTHLGGRLLAGDLQPAFMVSLLQKDLRIVQDAAGNHHLPLPGVALAQQLLRGVEALPGGHKLGTQAMMLALRRLAGEHSEIDAAPKK